MVSVAVIDYGMCNLDSVGRALEECGASVTATDDPDELRRADRLVLPGVGAFPHGMHNLHERGLAQAILDEVEHGAPLLGICLGMQLLASRGEEAGGADGLGLVPGVVERLVPTDSERRIPHVGWNEVDPLGTQPLFAGIEPATDFYFVHSFHIRADPSAVAAVTPYMGGFTSAVSVGAVHGVQFHPEKSQSAGFALLRNFLDLPC